MRPSLDTSPDPSGIKVIAPLLIVLRVAKQRALTGDSIVSGNVGTMNFRNQGESSTGDDEIFAGEDPVPLMGVNGEISDDRGVGASTIVGGGSI